MIDNPYQSPPLDSSQQYFRTRKAPTFLRGAIAGLVSGILLEYGFDTLVHQEILTQENKPYFILGTLTSTFLIPGITFRRRIEHPSTHTTNTNSYSIGYALGLSAGLSFAKKTLQ